MKKERSRVIAFVCKQWKDPYEYKADITVSLAGVGCDFT
jgi:hypothetical protein